MDRTLVAETPPLFVQADAVVQRWNLQTATEWRSIDPGTFNQYWLHESTIDLGGYTRQDDMTVYFRASFEQKAGPYTAVWFAREEAPLSGYDAAMQELTIISSVPFTDTQILNGLLIAPGFTVYSDPAFPADFGNFDRTHIIHGRRIDHTVSSTFGASQFTNGGEGYLLPVDTCEFSSLEPTAADTLYVYRVMAFPRPSIQFSTGLTLAAVPSRRIILDIMLDTEPELSYMMRLKRSYELANQV
jgi:hypothetical protein